MGFLGIPRDSVRSDFASVNYTGPRPPGEPRHVKRFRITPAAIIDVFKFSGPHVVSFAGMPRDARVLGVYFDPQYQVLDFLIESSEFAPVDPGAAIEVFGVQISNRPV